MGLFNPFYFIKYFIKCFIRVFTKKYFKLILLLLIILIVTLFCTNIYAIDLNDINYVDLHYSYRDWMENLNEYKSGNYYYALGTCYDGTGSPSSYYTSYVVFISKSDVQNNNIKFYWDNTQSPYNYLLFLCYSGNVATVEYKNGSTTPFASLSNRTRSEWFFKSINNVDLPFESDLPAIYTNNSYTTQSFPPVTNPYFETSSSDLSTFNFDYFTINGGSMPYKNTIEGIEHTAELTLDYTYKGVRTIIPIDNYLQVKDNLWTINIPYNVINNNVIVKNGESFYYRLTYSLYGTNFSGAISIDGTYNLTTEEENNINEEGNKQLLNQLQANQNMTNQKLDQQTNAINNQTNAINNQTNAINNQTQKIDDLNNSINDDNVDDINQDSLPSDSTNDITKDGVNGIFTSIYNAFCTGEPVNIDFPIPNTNKSISLSPSYVYDSLSNFGGGFLVMLIQAFWWYLISRFIIKDIVNKINKIKSGNIENIETSNIRGDML